MKMLLLIISIGIICSSCGKKGDPQYKSVSLHNITIDSK